MNKHRETICFPVLFCCRQAKFSPSLPDTELVEGSGKCRKHFFNCLQPKFPPLGGQSKLTLLP